MSTGQSLVNRAGRLLGVLASNTDMAASEAADALAALNALFGTWNNPRNLCFATRTEALTITSGLASFAIGPSGDLVTTRPVDIERAWIVASNYSYQLTKRTDDEYDSIIAKTTQGDWPTDFNYRATMPNGTIYVYPVANASRTLNLSTRTPLASIALTDTVSLPPGWEDALAFNLAVVLAPEYETEPSATVVQRARLTEAAIRVTNAQPIKAPNELVRLFPRAHSHILTDD